MKQGQREAIRGRHPQAWSRAVMVGHVALALWFAYWAWRSVAGMTWQWPGHLDQVGVDGRLYFRAAQTWLSGGDPWSAYTQTNPWPIEGAPIRELFTAPPSTLLAFVPFVWLPEEGFVAGWMMLTLLSALYTVRRLKLPIYWLLFPPMVTGVVAGNPHVVALAMLLCGSNWVRAIAAPMKAYAAIPMLAERQWRAIAILGIAGTVSLLAFWPLWHEYLGRVGQIGAWIAGPGTDGGFSAARDPRLFVITVTALGLLAIIDRRAAGWLAVPGLWPGTEYFYATFALPLRSPWLAVLLAYSQPKAAAIVPWAIIVYAVVRVSGRVFSALWRRGRRTEGMNVDHAGVADREAREMLR